MAALTRLMGLALLASLVLLSACAPRTGQTLLVQDTFDDARNNWSVFQTQDALAFIGDGRLNLVVRRPDALAWSVLQGRSLADFTLDVDATPLAGPDDNDYGVLVRHVDDDNFYRLEISGDGYYNIQKRLKGKWHKLVADWTETAAIRKGKTANHLRVTCAGATLTFSVNGMQVAQIKDDAFARGEIGFLAGTLEQPGVHVAFDNLQVSQP